MIDRDDLGFGFGAVICFLSLFFHFFRGGDEVFVKSFCRVLTVVDGLYRMVNIDARNGSCWVVFFFF